MLTLRSFEEELLVKVRKLAKRNKRNNRRQEIAHVDKHIRSHDSIQIDSENPGLWIEGNSASTYGALITLASDIVQIQNRDSGFGAKNNTPFKLDTQAPTDTINVNSSGQVGIGTSSHSIYKLRVIEDSENYVAQFRNTDETNHGIRVNAGPDKESTVIYCDFRNTVDGALLGRIIGDGAGGVNYTSTSDIRLKKDVEELPNVLNKIKDIKAISYRGINSNSKQKNIGLSAQNVRESFPTVVNESEDGFLCISYDRLTPILIKAIQELTEKLEKLEDETK